MGLSLGSCGLEDYPDRGRDPLRGLETLTVQPRDVDSREGRFSVTGSYDSELEEQCTPDVVSAYGIFNGPDLSSHEWGNTSDNIAQINADLVSISVYMAQRGSEDITLIGEYDSFGLFEISYLKAQGVEFEFD